ncbi:MAG: ATP-binding protein [Hahellaceae bacterium]|nr:ATP-binding protein [Hahellaceae bacterium]MCP5211133.1 ATP-binding protein [Hahellaceae bacterium]
MKIDIFPLDIAKGPAFCNREKERALLKNNIDKNTHTIIYAPRRYGKTSLVLKACDEMEKTSVAISHLDVDLMWVTSIEDVLHLILKETSQLLSRIIPKYEQALLLLKDIGKHVEASVSLSNNGVKLDLKAAESTPDTLIDALNLIDSVAAKKKRKVVIFLDEFQQISELPERVAVESAFRSAAQKATHTTYIFSGSNRHMLAMMFEDKSRPLYHMCDQLNLKRISAERYLEHINNAAKMHWKKDLCNDVLSAILDLTRRHPYYVNSLCRLLFQQEQPPTTEQVSAAWCHYVNREEKRFLAEFRQLSNVQRKLLHGLCVHPTSQPTSAEFLRKANVKHGSVNKALDKLYTLDMIHQSDNGIIEPTDPVILYGIKQKQ